MAERSHDNTADRRVDVVIAGGGIAGLATAVALAGKGLSLALIEAKEPAALPAVDASETDPRAFDARVSALTGRSIKFLDRLGAWPAITAARSCAYRHMTVWDAEGTGRIEFDASEVGAPSLGTIVENSLVTGALLERAQDQAGLQIRAPAVVAELERQESCTTVVLESGERLGCDLLVAADGALSPTRERLGMRTREWDYGHRAIVSTVRFERSHERTAWQRFLSTGPLALLPLQGADERLCSIVWSIEEDCADELLGLDEQGFCDALTTASEAALGAAVACAPRYAFPLRQRHAVDYVLPGIALVADAAHTIHPLAGQGINLGLADVEVLADEVARAVERGLNPGRLDVLRRYQRRRKADNLAMMAAMDGFKRLFAQDALPVRWLRNQGLRSVNAISPLKRRLIRQAMGVA